MTISRRAFIAGGLGLGAATLAATSSSASFTTSDIEYTNHVFRSPQIGKGLDGFRIAFLSDIHFGVAMPDQWLEEAIEKIAAEQVDLLLLGGDNLFIPSSALAASFAVVRNPRYRSGSNFSLAKRPNSAAVRRPFALSIGTT